MRLRTHYVFTMGVLFPLGVNVSPLQGIVMAGILSVASNLIIDRLGHEVRWGYVRRTPMTHTLPRSVMWGFLPALFIFLLLYFSGVVLWAVPLMGLLSGPSHLLLDIFTERGIYVKKKRRWSRFALAHFRYDNPMVNLLAVLAGLGIIILTLYVRGVLLV